MKLCFITFEKCMRNKIHGVCVVNYGTSRLNAALG